MASAMAARKLSRLLAGLSDPGVKLGDAPSDGIEVAPVGRQGAELRTGGFDDPPVGGSLERGESVENDNVSGAQDRDRISATWAKSLRPGPRAYARSSGRWPPSARSGRTVANRRRRAWASSVREGALDLTPCPPGA